MDFDKDLTARQEARAAARAAEKAQHILADMPQEKLDAIVETVAKAFSREAAMLASLAVRKRASEMPRIKSSRTGLPPKPWQRPSGV